MALKILINGPPGAGKSTIVRQIMSLYAHRDTIHGGVGGLPLGYDLWNHVQRTQLEVLGNYENDRRDRHGMCQFDRFPHDFEYVMRHANGCRTPVLCEGGFIHVKRMNSDAAREFCAQCVYVWLDPPEARTEVESRRGRDFDAAGYAKRVDLIVRVRDEMAKCGAKIRSFDVRKAALMCVADLTVTPMVGCPNVEQNYR